MKCPNCNAEVNEGMKFCPSCGQQIPQNRTCPNCGNELSEGMMFCNKCGTKVQNGSETNNTSSEQNNHSQHPQNKKNKSSYTFITTCICFIIFVILYFVLWGNPFMSVEDKARDYITREKEALEEKDFNKAEKIEQESDEWFKSLNMDDQRRAVDAVNSLPK